MKKLLTKLALAITMFSTLSLSALAVTADELVPRITETDPEIAEKYDEVNAIANLPAVTIERGIGDAIKAILGWSMAFTIVAIVVAAMYYLISQGNDDDISKAKTIILYLIIGIAIMAAAYGIITGITQFDFFAT